MVFLYHAFFGRLVRAWCCALRGVLAIFDARGPDRRVIASSRNVRAVATRSNAVGQFGQNHVKHDLSFFLAPRQQ
jgi:hypothetical protein